LLLRTLFREEQAESQLSFMRFVVLFVATIMFGFVSGIIKLRVVPFGIIIYHSFAGDCKKKGRDGKKEPSFVGKNFTAPVDFLQQLAFVYRGSIL